MHIVAKPSSPSTDRPMSAKLISRLRRAIRRPRMLSSAVLALAMFAFLSPSWPPARAMLVSFNLGAALYLVLMFKLMRRATVSSMRDRARVQSEGQWAVLLMTVCVAAAVLGALSQELHAARNKSLADIALASSTILLAWLFVAVVFAEHYAHRYYMFADQLQFPGTITPDYWDFSYFSVVISMCCQTSDILITAAVMRRIVLLHSVVSFFFNVIIIAISVNIAANAF